MHVTIPAVSKKLTKTMMEKGNPDCFKDLARLARVMGIDFDLLSNGEKKELPLHFPDGTETVIRFYRVTGKGGRKDKRYSIPATVFKAQASAGDVIAFNVKVDDNGDVMLCANVTRNPEYTNWTTDDIEFEWAKWSI